MPLRLLVCLVYFCEEMTIYLYREPSKKKKRKKAVILFMRAKITRKLLRRVTRDNLQRRFVARKIEHRVTWRRGRFFAQHMTRQRVASF